MIFVAGAGAVLIVVIVWDVFEVMVLPRRVTRRLRPTRLFYRSTWSIWSAIASRMRGGMRETYLSFFGPLSLLLLFSMWAAILLLGFALVQWGLGSHMSVHSGTPGFGTALYLSGTTFFTLGLGDVAPVGRTARILTVLEAGTGFGFLALVIGYLPVLYQSFSRREVNITLLDARAGSPPSAEELLRRHAGDLDALTHLLGDWERWSAEFLESHLSYPVLSSFRSPHDNQSWLAALTTILDASALVIVATDGRTTRQAQLTFAIARHAVVDLAQVLRTPPRAPVPDRLPARDLRLLADALDGTGVRLPLDDRSTAQLAALRGMYEPYVNALADRLLMSLPTWGVATSAHDNWKTSAWGRSSFRVGAPRRPDVHDERF